MPELESDPLLSKEFNYTTDMKSGEKVQKVAEDEGALQAKAEENKIGQQDKPAVEDKKDTEPVTK